MARELTEEQRRALARVQELNLERRRLRTTLEADVRREMEARTRKAAEAEARAVAAAVAAGVSKRRIGVEGLHTRDPYAVPTALAALES